jgi:transposase InsO family protein/transposase-like protein
LYSYDERMKAVSLYMEYDLRGSAAIRKLGYPSRRALRDWHKEFLQAGDLHHTYAGRSRYSDQQKRKAVEYYLSHGENTSGTTKTLGYPCRETLRTWIDELMPGLRRVPIRSGPTAELSEEQKREAVVELCSREVSASSVADAFGVCRVSLYNWKHRLLRDEGRLSVKDPEESPSSDDRDELSREVESLRKRIHRLQLEHDILKGANELLKKDQGISPQNLMNLEKTLLVDALRTIYKLSELLEQLQMPRSSYFYHRARLRSPEKYAELRETITEIFQANKRCYGYRRIRVELQRAGLSVSEKVIRRIMAEEGLVVFTTRRRRYSSYNGEISPAVDNVVDRDFHADAPNKKWLTDITEFQLPAGKAYLSPIIDCFDGMVVSWTIGTSPDADLVNTMLDTAVAGLAESERPIVHSDRGSHYRWPGWIDRMDKARLTRSMSKKGCTPDNAACEGFFGRLKNEMYYNRGWNNVSMVEFIDLLDEYIHWYNQKRIKLTLGGLSPTEYRESPKAAA